jgi:hypothetical protein
MNRRLRPSYWKRNIKNRLWNRRYRIRQWIARHRNCPRGGRHLWGSDLPQEVAISFGTNPSFPPVVAARQCLRCSMIGVFSAQNYVDGRAHVAGERVR